MAAKKNYVSIQEVENGFIVNMNEYSQDKPRVSKVARNVEELHEILREMFPPEETE